MRALKESEEYGETVEMIKKYPRPDLFGQEKNRVREYQTYQSIIPEIAISSQIEKISQLPEFQEAAKKAGFEGITYVPTLGGVIDRSSKRKIKIRKYIPGENLEDWFIAKHAENGENDEFLEQMETGLTGIFRANGIQPSDFYWEQLLINEGHLYLIDAEMFIKQQEEIS